MSTLTFRSVKNIGYNPPVGLNVDTSEYCKFDNKEIELEDNEIEAPSEDECEQDSDGEEDNTSECIMTTDDSCSEVSEDCDFPAIIKKRRRVIEKVYNVVLQEEEFLPE